LPLDEIALSVTNISILAFTRKVQEWIIMSAQVHVRDVVVTQRASFS